MVGVGVLECGVWVFGEGEEGGGGRREGGRDTDCEGEEGEAEEEAEVAD